MYPLLTTLQKADPKRLAKAATGLADGSLSVALAYQDMEEVRALVVNEEQKEYTVVVDSHRAFCSCLDALYRIGKTGKDGKALYACYHALAVALFALQHPDATTQEERCTVCGRTLAAERGLRVEDGNDGRVIQAGPFCKPCGLAKLEEARSALESAENTLQSRTSAAA